MNALVRLRDPHSVFIYLIYIDFIIPAYCSAPKSAPKDIMFGFALALANVCCRPGSGHPFRSAIGVESGHQVHACLGLALGVGESAVT